LPAQFVREPAVVVIEKRDPVAVRTLHAAIAGGGRVKRPIERQYTKPGVTCFQERDPRFFARLGGHDNNLDCAESLAQGAFHGPHDEPRAAARGNDDGHGDSG
jgi:hypothetical protein